MPTHPIPPVYDQNSRVLILGSFPSVKSREAAFFYGHPQNRFWKVLSAVLGCSEPQTVEDKKRLLLDHHIALWDVIASCEITGSSDSSIKNVLPNDVGLIHFCQWQNGRKALQQISEGQARPRGFLPALHITGQRRMGNRETHRILACHSTCERHLYDMRSPRTFQLLRRYTDPASLGGGCQGCRIVGHCPHRPQYRGRVACFYACCP